MGFDHIAIPPPFAPGAVGDVFVTADFDRANPILGVADDTDAVEAIARLCAEHELKLILDIDVGRVAGDGIAARHDWFYRTEDGALPDPRIIASSGVAMARFDVPDIADVLARWWIERLRTWLGHGVTGFRCLGIERVPADFWSKLISGGKDNSGGGNFIAATAPDHTTALHNLPDLGFDYTSAVVDRLSRLDEIEAPRRIAPIIAMPELPFGRRLAPRGGALLAEYRRAMDLAATIGDGVMVPMGFEFAGSRRLDPVYSVPADLAEAEGEAPFALDAEIAAANIRLDREAALRLGGRWRRLTPRSMLRTSDIDPRRSERGLVAVINDDLGGSRPLDFSLSPLPPAAGAAFDGTVRFDGGGAPDAPLLPGEVRLLQVARSKPVATEARANRQAVQRATKAPRIVIEAITPCVENGRFAAKRVVGDDIEIEADIFIDGHEAIAAALLWRPADRTDWSRAPLAFVENDRWRGSFRPARVGRHVFAVEAWLDCWASTVHDIEAKHAAGQDVTLDIADVVLMVNAAKQTDLAKKLAGADRETQIALLLSDDARVPMAAADDHPFLVRSDELLVDVDRPQAGFSSWYELFPRSATDDPKRHGTFDDVIRRLPAIAAMGFDILYFPPIHPIGTTNRKGRNNALEAEADAPGSPYAIGSAKGGHTAIDPALGTFEDFRRLRDAAYAHGLEIALDFAVQCSPDHPWLEEHPDWFRRRADGSIRYAENPPKKYEDIVNPDFYASAAMPDLWLALRDVLSFWIDEGIRIFRVDNPHTKPLPFWEWLIADIRARQPDVIFLAEAFTRPKLMYRLAKLGFNQSYSYFTWRNAKWELTEYLRELADGPPRDFFRPNFFVNTPDINPYFLQHSGRAGFLIRAVLAATLSGAWGLYSGFELCESAPLPGREEYLDSEKYQLRPRDFTAPGNIVAEITQLNRIRRGQPSLQSHLGVTFYNAFSDHIMVYGKARRRRGEPLREMILVFVNLDPHQIQEAAYELPLWEFGLPDHGTLTVDDLVRPNRFTLTGKLQRMRLDPAVLPYAIWRLSAGNA